MLPTYNGVPTASEEMAMRDTLKLLNDRSAGDLSELTDDELRSFEALCETWRTHAEAERARRQSLPHPTASATQS